MDLLLVIGGFYLWQCLQYVPPNTAAFIPLVGRYSVIRGGGMRLLNPIPSRVTLFGSRPAIGVPGNDVVVIAPPRFAGFGLQTQRPREVPTDALDNLQVADSRVKLGTKTLAQASSSAEARLLARQLIDVARRRPVDRMGVLDDALSRSLSQNDCSERLSHMKSHIRILGWCCNVYALMLLVLAPVIITLPFLEEALFLGLAPVIGVTHIVTLIVLFRTHRTLFPGQSDERTELILVSALFPPSLLAAPQRLGASAVAGFHPATLASLLLDPRDASHFVRREIALARYHDTLTREWGTPAWDGQLEGTPVPNGDQFQMLIDRGETDSGSRPTTRQRTDPSDISYCPLCDSDFAVDVGTCTDCRVPTETYV